MEYRRKIERRGAFINSIEPEMVKYCSENYKADKNTLVLVLEKEKIQKIIDDYLGISFYYGTKTLKEDEFLLLLATLFSKNIKKQVIDFPFLLYTANDLSKNFLFQCSKYFFKDPALETIYKFPVKYLDFHGTVNGTGVTKGTGGITETESDVLPNHKKIILLHKFGIPIKMKLLYIFNTGIYPSFIEDLNADCEMKILMHSLSFLYMTYSSVNMFSLQKSDQINVLSLDLQNWIHEFDIFLKKEKEKHGGVKFENMNYDTVCEFAKMFLESDTDEFVKYLLASKSMTVLNSAYEKKELPEKDKFGSFKRATATFFQQDINNFIDGIEQKKRTVLETIKKLFKFEIRLLIGPKVIKHFSLSLNMFEYHYTMFTGVIQSPLLPRYNYDIEKNVKDLDYENNNVPEMYSLNECEFLNEHVKDNYLGLKKLRFNDVINNCLSDDFYYVCTFCTSYDSIEKDLEKEKVKALRKEFRKPNTDWEYCKGPECIVDLNFSKSYKINDTTSEVTGLSGDRDTSDTIDVGMKRRRGGGDTEIPTLRKLSLWILI